MPVAALPGWLHPFSRAVFPSWSADLLRDAVRGDAGGPLWPVAAILGLGAAAMAAGLWLTRHYVDRSRREGMVESA